MVPYDFRRPSKLSREHIRALQMAYETFARRMTTLLTSSLRQVCQVGVTDISQQSYEEYVTGLESQTLLAPLTLAPLAGTGVLEFSLPVALAAIDHMLGGPGGQQAPRTLTDIETTLMRGLLEQTVATLRYALEPIVAVSPALGPIEYNPQFVQAAPASEPVITAVFAIQAGDSESSASFMIPAEILLAGLRAGEDLDARSDEERAAQRHAQAMLVRGIREVPVDVSVRFASRTVHPRDVVSLAVGDVVPLSHRTSTPLDVVVDGVVMARAAAGSNGNRLACMVVTVEENH